VRIGLARGVTPRFVTVLLAVLGYWALVSYGRAQLGSPNASRYIYSGVMLLIPVILESLRGLKLNWRSVTAVVVISVLATIGGLRAFGPGESGLFQGSTSEAAELYSLGLMRSFVPPGLTIDSHWSPQITAAAYFPATARLHSTGADTLGQLLVSPEEQRSSADLVLVAGGDLAVTQPTTAQPAGTAAPHVKLELGGRLTRHGGCVRFVPSGKGSTLDLLVPAAGLSVHGQSDAASASDPPTDIYARRFASGYENLPVASFMTTRTYSVVPHPDADSAAFPWHVRVSPWETVTVCTVGA
jgi:hypothetical protein